MLDEDVANHTAIINAMRAWHRLNAVPPPALGIGANAANTQWDIPYGYAGAQSGSIRIRRDNFEVAEVTNAGGVFGPFVYNHVWPGLLNYGSISGALSCTDLATNHGARSIVILLASESARSRLVERFVQAVLGGAADANSYQTVRALTAEYEHTQRHVGGQVNAGPGWTPLEIQDHLNFSLHSRKVVNQFDGIHGLNSFLNSL